MLSGEKAQKNKFVIFITNIINISIYNGKNCQLTVIIITVIIIMVSFKCNFSRDHIAPSLRNGENIKLRKPIE